MFEDFKNRKDTFSMGICNGCQLMGLLGWVNGHLEKNISGRFESRYSTVKVSNTDNVFFRGLHNFSFGMWVAHGEGRFDKDFHNTYTPIHS